ncbi:MAG: glycosyltransferase family 4 protein [Bacteroidales bacterium]|nr:glycosyltransferase family 4 protein [Bacteroidales bacterium]
MKADNILTVGVECETPRGGIASVEHSYSLFFTPWKQVVTSKDCGRLKNLLVLLKALLRFEFLMWTDRKIQIVHIHAACYLSFWRKSIFIYLGKFHGKKVVYHCHGAEFKSFALKNKIWVQMILNRCDSIIALSSAWKEWFEHSLGCKNVVVVKNIIEQPQRKDKIFENSPVFRLLFLGLLGKRKGIFDLLDVIAENKDLYQGRLELLFGGNGEVEQVEKIIQQYEIQSIAKYQGWVSGDKKIELLNQADALILPSYAEGLPICILEAMAYKLPIISTNVGGIPEIVINERNGFLFNPGDKKAMKKSIDILMNNKDLSKQMGEMSSNMIIEHLPENVERQLSVFYNSLLEC